MRVTTALLASLLASSSGLAATPSPAAEPEPEPLQLGAQFYLRSEAQHRRGASLGESAVAMPTFVDVSLDARPTARLRAFVSGRLVFDPTLSPAAEGTRALTPGFGFGGLRRPASNPAALLDQAWIRIELPKDVQITAGKQHEKWGTSRFFNPTDFLMPERRDPLLVFDPRLGASMVKVEVSPERWSVAAMALFDNAGPARVLGELGAAARAELTLKETTAGIGAVLQEGRAPRYALDVAAALGQLGLHAEVALQKGSERPLFRFPADPIAAGGFVEEYEAPGLNPMASGGLRWTLRSLTLGAEYFYNSLGANAVQLYPYLIVTGQFVPFYTGQHYAAAYAHLAAPASWNDSTFTLTNVTNLTDLSVISRLDSAHRLARGLTLEAFGAVHYGQRGEFKLGGDIPSFVLPGGEVTQAFAIAEPVFELGVGVRLEL